MLGGLYSGTTRFLRKTRGWCDEEYDAATGRLRRARLARRGRRRSPTRAATSASSVEDETDRLALEGWAHVGAGRTARLHELVEPLRGADHRGRRAPGGDPAVSDFHDLGDQRFVSLTTYRRTGGAGVHAGVGGPRRRGPAGDHAGRERQGQAAAAHHPGGAGAVQPQRQGRSRRQTVQAVATLGEPDRPAVFRAKYGLEYRVFMLVERIVAKGNRDRVLVRIRPA